MVRVAAQDNVRERPPNGFHRVSTSHWLDDQLRLEAPFQPLAGFICEHARPFLKALGFPSYAASISQMWVNVGEKGDFVYPHTHPGGGTFIAGVFYVKCDPRDGINFHLPLDRDPPEEINELSTSGSYYEGMEGRLSCSGTIPCTPRCPSKQKNA